MLYSETKDLDIMHVIVLNEGEQRQLPYKYHKHYFINPPTMQADHCFLQQVLKYTDLIWFNGPEMSPSAFIKYFLKTMK